MDEFQSAVEKRTQDPDDLVKQWYKSVVDTFGVPAVTALDLWAKDPKKKAGVSFGVGEGGEPMSTVTTDGKLSIGGKVVKNSEILRKYVQKIASGELGSEVEVESEENDEED